MTPTCTCTCCRPENECRCPRNSMELGTHWCPCTYCQQVRAYYASYQGEEPGHKALVHCTRHSPSGTCFVTLTGTHIGRHNFTMRAIYLCSQCQRPFNTRGQARNHILQHHHPLSPIRETHW